MTNSDQVFKTSFKRRLPLPSFIRSSIVSLSFVVLLYFVYTSIFPAKKGDGPSLFYTLVLALVFNVIPDYISLIESRLVIDRLSKSNSIAKKAFLAFLDILFTLSIAFIGSLIADVLFPLVEYVTSGFHFSKITSWNIPFTFKNVVTVYGQLLGVVHTDRNDKVVTGYCGVYIYSTFFTSFWVWLYLLSGKTVVFARGLNKGKALITSFFDVEKKPISTMGWVLILQFSGLFWLVYAFKTV